VTHFQKNSKKFNFIYLILQEEWARVLKEAGAKIVQRLFSERADRLDYVLSDRLPEPEIAARAKEAGVKIVSVEWVIECVLVQEVVPLEQSKGFVYQ
jgi:hypothetical protein